MCIYVYIYIYIHTHTHPGLLHARFRPPVGRPAPDMLRRPEALGCRVPRATKICSNSSWRRRPEARLQGLFQFELDLVAEAGGPWLQGASSYPVRIVRIRLPRFAPRVGLPGDRFLIGSLTAALRLSKGWVRKDPNLGLRTGCIPPETWDGLVLCEPNDRQIDRRME